MTQLVNKNMNTRKRLRTDINTIPNYFKNGTTLNLCFISLLIHNWTPHYIIIEHLINTKNTYYLLEIGTEHLSLLYNKERDPKGSTV